MLIENADLSQVFCLSRGINIIQKMYKIKTICKILLWRVLHRTLSFLWKKKFILTMSILRKLNMNDNSAVSFLHYFYEWLTVD